MRQALDLHVTRHGPAQFHVESAQGEDEWVEIVPDLVCHCHDALDRDVICRHLAAALLAQGDKEAVRLAGDIEHEAQIDDELYDRNQSVEER